jgi:hypothetical protein
VKLEGQNTAEIDFFGGLPTRNLELETGSGNQQSADTTGAKLVAKVLGHLTHTLGSELDTHTAQPNIPRMRN